MTHIGSQVRYWRLRRGLKVKPFADRVGKSVSWVEQIESGSRQLVRLPMLETVAGVLGVTVQALTDPVESQRAATAPDAAEVAAIRGALGQYEVILGAPLMADLHPKLPDLAKRVRYLDQAFSASSFSVIGRDIPRLMIETQRAADEHPGVEAARLLVKTYRLASSTLLKLGADETAWLAADRAMLAAQRSGDLYCLGRATRSVARSLTSLGQTVQALDALLAVAARMEPEIGGETLEISALYGMVLLAAEIAAAKLGDAATATNMHDEAMRIALARFPDRHDPETVFCPTNVWLHWVSSLNRLGRPGEALDRAHAIDPDALSRLPRERRGTLALDMAAAHLQLGNHDQATAAMLAAHRIAPEEATCRPGSRHVIASLVGDTTRTPSPELRALAAKAGVQA